MSSKSQPQLVGCNYGLNVARRSLLIIAYVLVSATLIRFNKSLMHRDRFPYAMALTSLHMAAASLCCLVLYQCRPGDFPAMAQTRGDRLWVLKWFVPIGLVYALGLAAANYAYFYCSIVFVQFMRQGNIFLVFLMSCVLGLQRMTALRLLIIMVIIGGQAIAVSDETGLIWIGFFVQLVAQLADCARMVIGEIVLGDSGLRLDPLSYALFVAPTCLVVLLAGTVATWDPRMPQALAEWWPLVVPSTVLACALNLLVPYLLKELSAVGSTQTGILRDVTLVFVSWACAHEAISALQLVGFAVTLSGVLIWCYIKASPDSYAVRSLEQALGATLTPRGAPTERTRLKRGLEDSTESAGAQDVAKEDGKP